LERFEEGWIDEDDTWRRFPIGSDVPLKRLVLEVLTEEGRTVETNGFVDSFAPESLLHRAGVDQQLRGQSRPAGADDGRDAGRRRPGRQGQLAVSLERRRRPRAPSEERSEMVKVNQTITAAQAEFLREQAYLRGISQSEIVREALSEAMAQI
jgi:hypothetical protein